MCPCVTMCTWPVYGNKRDADDPMAPPLTPTPKGGRDEGIAPGRALTRTAQQVGQAIRRERASGGVARARRSGTGTWSGRQRRSRSTARWPRERVDHIPFATHPSTENNRHVPGTPFSSWSPRSSKSIPEPTIRSITVLVTSTSPRPAKSHTRLAMVTARPAMSSPRSSTSPV